MSDNDCEQLFCPASHIQCSNDRVAVNLTRQMKQTSTLWTEGLPPSRVTSTRTSEAGRARLGLAGFGTKFRPLSQPRQEKRTPASPWIASKLNRRLEHQVSTSDLRNFLYNFFSYDVHVRGIAWNTPVCTIGYHEQN